MRHWQSSITAMQQVSKHKTIADNKRSTYTAPPLPCIYIQAKKQKSIHSFFGGGSDSVGPASIVSLSSSPSSSSSSSTPGWTPEMTRGQKLQDAHLPKASKKRKTKAAVADVDEGGEASIPRAQQIATGIKNRRAVDSRARADSDCYIPLPALGSSKNPTRQ